LSFDPAAVARRAADRLAQSEGGWRPFERSGARRLLYPNPQRSA